MRRAYGYTLIVVLCWAISLPTGKALLLAERAGERLTPLQASFWSIGVGWLALLLVLAMRGRLGTLRAITGRGWLVLVAMGFFGWAGYVVALNTAFVRIPLPDAIVINYLHPVFVVLFQGRAFGTVARAISGWEQSAVPAKRPRAWPMAAGLALCLCGVAFIVTDGRLAQLASLRLSTGALAALFAAFSWGVYSNLGRFVQVRAGTEDGGLGDVQSWLAMTFGLAMIGIGLAFGAGPGLPSGRETAIYLGSRGPHLTSAWVFVAIMGVLVYGYAYSLWLVALEIGRRAGIAHRLPPLTYLTPALGVLIGLVVLHEPFGPAFWQGAGLIAAGNLVIALGRSGGRSAET